MQVQNKGASNNISIMGYGYPLKVSLIAVLGFFIAFWFIGDIAVCASSMAGPMYISEIAPTGIRCRLAALSR